MSATRSTDAVQEVVDDTHCRRLHLAHSPSDRGVVALDAGLPSAIAPVASSARLRRRWP